jgi:CubicO group peptidase (beta-lactamase class C family)
MICATASVALCLAPACFAQDAARMEQIVQSYVDAGSFMGTVLVARGDTVLMSKAYGSANLEWKIPNTTTTKFRLGSVTKQFTAASILLLEERGKMVQHGGGIQGFNTDLRYFPDTGITIVVLANLNGPASAIGEKLGQAAHSDKVTLNSERQEITLKPEQLTPLAGVYELRPGSNLVITAEGGQLMAQTLGQPKRPVFAESESRFFSKTADVQLEFERNASGEVTHVIVQQGAAKMRAPRKPRSSTQ